MRTPHQIANAPNQDKKVAVIGLPRRIEKKAGTMNRHRRKGRKTSSLAFLAFWLGQVGGDYAAGHHVLSHGSFALIRVIRGQYFFPFPLISWCRTKTRHFHLGSFPRKQDLNCLPETQICENSPFTSLFCPPIMAPFPYRDARRVQNHYDIFEFAIVPHFNTLDSDIV